MAGRPQKPNALGLFEGQDAKGKYAKKCIKFADELGYARKYVCEHWGQLALELEFICKYSRALAEDAAWNHIRGALWEVKQGGECN